MNAPVAAVDASVWVRPDVALVDLRLDVVAPVAGSELDTPTRGGPT